jgi:hypothetical protein
MKKRIQNEKRKGLESAPEVKSAGAGGRAPSEGFVKYLQMVTSEIEGRRVSREEILAVIARQRSIHKGKGTGDNGSQSDEHPP